MNILLFLKVKKDAFNAWLFYPIVGVKENTKFKDVFIYPNPTQKEGLLNIRLGNLKEVSIKTFNVFGKLVYQKENINTSIHKLKLSVASGVYIVEISAQGKTQPYKLVKN
jgi:hypothetical protein